MEHLPWSETAFAARARSYTPARWPAGAAVTPLRCARHGWSCEDGRVLHCAACEAFLGVPERAAGMREKLVERHAPHCPWRHMECPLSFEEPSLDAASFDRRRLSFRPLQAKAALEPRFFAALREQARRCSSPLDPLRVATNHTTMANVALALALCGWEMEKEGIIVCSLCFRRVGLWNFIGFDEETALREPPHALYDGQPHRPVTRSMTRRDVVHALRRPSFEAGCSIAPSSFGSQPAMHKVPDTPVRPSPVSYFHPVEEHRDFCPHRDAWKSLLRVLGGQSQSAKRKRSLIVDKNVIGQQTLSAVRVQGFNPFM